MLARPEVLSEEHILMWLASKPRRERYDWADRFACACAQYWTENVDAEHPTTWCRQRVKYGTLDQLNAIAANYRTFGSLHDNYEKLLQTRRATAERLAAAA